MPSASGPDASCVTETAPVARTSGARKSGTTTHTRNRHSVETAAIVPMPPSVMHTRATRSATFTPGRAGGGRRARFLRGALTACSAKPAGGAGAPSAGRESLDKGRLLLFLRDCSYLVDLGLAASTALAFLIARSAVSGKKPACTTSA